MPLSKETKSRIHKEAKEYSTSANVKLAYKSGASAEAERALPVVNAIREIARWEFATDGRRFNGDYKEVLKHIMDIALPALTKYNQSK